MKPKSMMDVIREKQGKGSGRSRHDSGSRPFRQRTPSPERSRPRRGDRDYHREPARTSGPSSTTVHVSFPPQGQHTAISRVETSMTHQRPGKEPAQISLPAPPPLADENHAVMEHLRNEFPSICFDNFIFVPRIRKPIADEAVKKALDLLYEAHTFGREWYRAAERISQVSLERKDMIEKLKIDLENERRISKTLAAEMNSHVESQAKAEHEAEEIRRQMKKLVDDQTDEVQRLHARNQVFMDERDKANSKLESAQKEIESLRSKLKYAEDERAEAQRIAQEASEDVASLKAQLVDVEVKAQQAANDEANDTLVSYNAFMLEYRNLEWFGEIYPSCLMDAWKRLVELRRRDDPNVDEATLQAQILTDEERNTLHSAELSMLRSDYGLAPAEAGESSGVAPPFVSADIPQQTETSFAGEAPTCSGSVVPSASIQGYDPTNPSISPASMAAGMSVLSSSTLDASASTFATLSEMLMSDPVPSSEDPQQHEQAISTEATLVSSAQAIGSATGVSMSIEMCKEVLGLTSASSAAESEIEIVGATEGTGPLSMSQLETKQSVELKDVKIEKTEETSTQGPVTRSLKFTLSTKGAGSRTIASGGTTGASSISVPPTSSTVSTAPSDPIDSANGSEKKRKGGKIGEGSQEKEKKKKK